MERKGAGTRDPFLCRSRRQQAEIVPLTRQTRKAGALTLAASNPSCSIRKAKELLSQLETSICPLYLYIIALKVIAKGKTSLSLSASLSAYIIF